MANILKTNPVGLDDLINDFQVFIYDKLGLPNWESYPRVYLNPNARGRLPEKYETNGEYKEVLYSDKFNMTSFFLADEKRDIIEGSDIMEVDVALIVQADLIKLFPAITHRADEELNNMFYNQSNQYFGNRAFRLKGIENGVDNVYKEFDRSRLKLEDMSNQYLVRFNYRVRYTPQC